MTRETRLYPSLELDRHASPQADESEGPVPTYLFCAPPEEISVGVLEAQTLAFYREMNRT